ncbi:MAG: glycosyltransferase family 2 protein [bacterium]|nr:glycosyltransferase family 2 protein [bacterium]
MQKLISIFTPCYNEEENIKLIYSRVKSVMNGFNNYSYEHVFIDNCSKDKTLNILRDIASKDKNVKIIVNAKNFGIIRSGFHGIIQCKGDAVIPIAADLQDPPEMIRDFILKWEEGYKLVIGVKTNSKENPVMYLIRKIFYDIISRIAETEQIKNFNGYALYDKSFIEVISKIDDPYPYFRGMVSDFGFDRYEIPYNQPKRERGKSSYSFYSLYDTAMQGFVNHSKVPLRLASFIGFGVAIISFMVAIGYFIYKLFYWDNFQVGVAPLVTGIFFFSGVQLFFLGIIGEYIGAIFTQVKKRPLVIEKERINF